MASNLRVDSIVPATGTNVSIGTATGGVNIPGVLTYEDVTNVDSVGVVTARTDINLGDSIIHIGDTNTKIRFPAADTVSVETAGSERLRITSGGQVNIGGDYTQTTYPFSVLGSTGGNNQINIVQRLKYSGDSNQYNTGTVIAFTNTNTNANAYSYIGARIDSGSSGANANALIFATNATNTAPTEKLRIGSAGQIGIAGANYGTSGQVLTSQGNSSAVQWATPSSVTTTSGTMTVGFRDHVANAVSSTTATGYYERIGNMVFCSVDTGAINLSGLNNSQILLLTGCFPITRHANWVMNGVATPVTINSGANSGGPVIVPRYGYWLSNTSLYFSIPRNNSSADNMTIGMMNSGNSRIYLQYSYKVA